jgi:hypothetical protein
MMLILEQGRFGIIELVDINTGRHPAFRMRITDEGHDGFYGGVC